MARIVHLLGNRLRETIEPAAASFAWLRATISVGSINGGTHAKYRPGFLHCASADRRTLPGEDEKMKFAAKFETLLRNGHSAILHIVTQRKARPVRTRWRRMTTTPPRCNPFLKVAGQRKPEGVNYFCDAVGAGPRGHSERGIFGPGDIAQAHTTDEWIELKSVERAASLLLRFFRSLP